MNIAVLCGGLSAERDVSITTGALTAAALRRRGHGAVLLDLATGYTQPYDNPYEVFTKQQEDTAARIGATAPDLNALRETLIENARIGNNVLDLCAAADIVFLALHGGDGEDGKIQALFDLHGIKYTGTGHLGSAIAMNKYVSKQLFRQNGILTPRAVLVSRDEAEIGDAFLPCVVKPCSGGSSVGASVVKTVRELESALALAFKYDERVLVEQYIQGRECNVGVLAGRALPVIEIRPKSGFFDYANKYQTGMAEEICPAELPDDIAERLRRMAERVFSVLHFDVYGRMDFIVDEAGQVWCLEGNTLPGMTATSLFPQEAAAVGIPYDELCELIVTESLKKYERKGASL